ncbi:hypothetical protein KI387_001669, partial [Taxus chinensis]
MRVCVSEQSQNNTFWETKPYPETALFRSGPESPTSWLEEGQHTGRNFPLPPLSISNSSPFVSSGSVSSSSSTVPRSPGKENNPPSPGSRWKKGKLLGRGTFGHVYAGLN